jgi:LEA14-like dessication related protein
MSALLRYRSLVFPLVVSCVAACSSVPRDFDPPRMSLANIAPKEVGLFEQRYDVQLRIQNPNDMDIHISGLRFDLELNDQEFANGMSGQRVSVPRFGSELVNVDVTSGLGGFLAQVQQFNRSGMSKARYRMKGTAFVDSPSRFKAPFDEKGEIDFNSLLGNLDPGVSDGPATQP